jgi:hypothetical protein
MQSKTKAAEGINKYRDYTVKPSPSSSVKIQVIAFRNPSPLFRLNVLSDQDRSDRITTISCSSYGISPLLPHLCSRSLLGPYNPPLDRTLCKSQSCY